jgi:hypothetical protein
MNKKIIGILLSGYLYSSLALAQGSPTPLFTNVPDNSVSTTPSVTSSGNKIDPRVVQPQSFDNDYNPDQLTKLNGLLSQQDYVGFFSYIKDLDVKDAYYIKFLESKKYDGHVPLYWLMADYYATHNNEQETHKWLYIATIMTQQDSYLCSDNSARYAAQKLSRAFPKTIDVTQRTPQYIDSVMPEVIYFIQNLKQRSDPKWACNFGEQDLPSSANITIPQANWKKQRDIVFKRFTDKYQR